MEEFLKIALYVAYTGILCWLIARVTVRWGKVLLTAAGLGGLASLPAIAAELAAVIGALLSFGLMLVIYAIGFVLLIRCVFPRFGR